MKRGSSESIISGSHSSEISFDISSYLTSHFSFQEISDPVLVTTRTVWTFGQPCIASSTFCFSGTFFPPLRPSSAVIIVRQSESKTLSFKDSGEKPPNTTECIAPILAQANIAYVASGIIGI